MKIICVGLNYPLHINELKDQKPSEPVLFMKPETAVIQNGQPFFIPDFSNEIHYEVEILVRINKVGKNIAERFAKNYYSEIGIGIDFTARDLQNKLRSEGMPWEICKGFDGSAAISKQFIPVADFENLGEAEFYLTKNDEIVQKGKISDMIFSIDQIIAHSSKYFMLKLGDIIFTGTPSGVGRVEEGDVLKAGINGQQLLEIRVK